MLVLDFKQGKVSNNSTGSAVSVQVVLVLLFLIGVLHYRMYGFS